MKSTIIFKFPVIILFYLLSGGESTTSFLSTVDYLTPPTQLYWSQTNNIGIAYDLPEFLPWASNTLLLSRIKLAAYSGWMGNIFYQTFHVPRGYKYNCSTAIYNGTVSCTKDLILNTSQTSAFARFVSSVSSYSSVDIGYDIERRNFSRSTYFTNFTAFFNLFAGSAVNPQLLDYGDKTSTIYNTTYGVAEYVNDLSVLSAKFFPPFINGPGITEDADSSWINALSTISQYYSTFTFRCIVFKNSSDVTIPNLMSDAYSEQYLRKRLVDGSGNLIDMVNRYYVGINDIRLVSGNGVDGVTNTFAAAIWALDTAISLSSLGGSFISFHNFFTSPNYQSIFGPGPGFQPMPIFYGILFASLVLNKQPIIQSGLTTAGTSLSIKSFGLRDVYGGYRVLLINKEMNASASGIVGVKMPNQGSIRCTYLSAPSLQSKSNITIGGMYFLQNVSEYQGIYEFRVYKTKAGENFFNVQLNYSQAVLCETIDAAGYPILKKMKRLNSFEYFVNGIYFLLLFYFLG